MVVYIIYINDARSNKYQTSYTTQQCFLLFLSLLLFIYCSFSLFVCVFFFVFMYRYTKITVIFLRKMFSVLSICYVIHKWCKTQQMIIVNMMSKKDRILTENFCWFLYYSYLLSSVPLSSLSFSCFFHIRTCVLVSFLLCSVSLILVLSIVPSFILIWARVKFWLLSHYISFCDFSFMSPSLSVAHVNFYQGLSNLWPVVNISELCSQIPPKNINKSYPHNKNQQDTLFTYILFK